MGAVTELGRLHAARNEGTDSKNDNPNRSGVVSEAIARRSPLWPFCWGAILMVQIQAATFAADVTAGNHSHDRRFNRDGYLYVQARTSCYDDDKSLS
jgi:hypothetical protein